ncbi:MAG: GntR family transcriptional regulator [Armatimonadetes bacterium]|nr:GntR family transcriptional regulator [Armatimonadota bacterium]
MGTMLFDVDTASSVPIYAQLITQVKHAVAAGILCPGDALPSLREVAAHLRINPLTVARAYRELETSGILTTEPGRGSFISAHTCVFREDYKQDALFQAVDRMLVDAHYLGAAPDEVRAALEDRLIILYGSNSLSNNVGNPKAREDKEESNANE